MKLGPINDASRIEVATATNSARTAPAQAVEAVNAAKPTDKVQLSGAAESIAARNQVPFDAEKVAAIRKAIADHEYKVQHEAIAKKIISEAASLLESIPVPGSLPPVKP
jgi:flagellar biosynthesis anti-sigma factor FlgM